MKISCPSCPAKYTIADEKVAGKIVKIRCKKCGATIVVNGAENQPDAAAGAPDSDAWMVNVADGDQRTMMLDELIAEFRMGTIHEDTYCWRDGMADWAALREIPELMSALGAGGAPSIAPSFGPGSIAGSDAGFGAGSFGNALPQAMSAMGSGSAFGDDDGATQTHELPHVNGTAAMPAQSPAQVAAALRASPHDLFGNDEARAPSAPAPAFAAAPAPTAARRAGARAGAGDLFGASAQAGGESEFRASMSNPAGGDPKLTGQRNENSVLFSLNALTSGGGPAKSDSRTTAEADASGLIDIRALSQSAGRSAQTSGASKVDDIMNLGGGGAFNAALIAPVLAPPSTGFDAPGGVGFVPQHSSGNKGLLIALLGMGGLLLVSVGVVAFLLLVRKPAEPLPVSTTVNPTVVLRPDPTVGSGAPNSEGPIAIAPVVGSATTSAPRGTGLAPAVTGKPATAGESAAKSFTPDTSATPAAATAKRSLEDQMRNAAGGGTTATPAAGNTDAPPFDRGAASAGLSGVNVASCKRPDGPTGSGHVMVTFGTSGSVQSAVADTPPFQGTPVGGCIAGKYRAVKIPAFSGSPLTVGKSFSLN